MEKTIKSINQALHLEMRNSNELLDLCKQLLAMAKEEENERKKGQIVEITNKIMVTSKSMSKNTNKIAENLLEYLS